MLVLGLRLEPELLFFDPAGGAVAEEDSESFLLEAADSFLEVDDSFRAGSVEAPPPAYVSDTCLGR